MRFTGLLRAIAARTSAPDVYDAGFDELSMDDERVEVDSMEGSTDGWTRRSSAMRPSGSTSVLTTTLAAATRADTMQPEASVAVSTHGPPAVCIQPDASIAVAFEQASLASSAPAHSPRQLDPDSAVPAQASEYTRPDHCHATQSLSQIRGESYPAVGDQSGSVQPVTATEPAAHLTKCPIPPRHQTSACPPPTAGSKGPVASAPSSFSSVASCAALQPQLHRHSVSTIPASGLSNVYSSNPRVAYGTGNSDPVADAHDGNMYPSGCVPFSRLPARALPSPASESRLHLWLQNDVLSSHTCV